MSSGILAWSAFANLVLGDRAYVSRNLVLTLGLWFVARRSGFGAAELGVHTGPAAVRGLRVGLVSLAVIAAVVALGVSVREQVPLISMLLGDVRADLDGGRLAYAVLVRIPFGTALFEEFLFRGLLLALLLRTMSARAAWIWAAVVFGLWHVPPTLATLRLNGVAPLGGDGLAAMVGAVVVTTVAGLGFTELRRRGGDSLLAPILAHCATNGAGLLAAAASRGG
ncbi:CPBP family glutamic-type intramembrane protease [Egicoccus halophilus]|uniref:CPBP family glutamic-type intramembrane protease n=1 Tax=Egicoccus halophilus TaxID=1670830 RepID=UPI00197A7748|nr:CPBP family glutamic-type intramembrane protease [Egicoccus halophilus]